MQLTLQMLRDEVRDMTGIDSDDMDNDKVDLYLNMTWAELQDKVRFRAKETQGEFATVTGQASYLLASFAPGFSYVTRVLYKNASGEFQDLVKTDYETYTQNTGLNVTEQGEPRQYALYRTNLYLDPIPDSAYVIRIIFQANLADLAAEGAPISPVWQEFIILGAAARIYRNLGEFARYTALLSMRDALAITTDDEVARDTLDARFTGFKPIRRRYR